MIYYSHSFHRSSDVVCLLFLFHLITIIIIQNYSISSFPHNQLFRFKFHQYKSDRMSTSDSSSSNIFSSMQWDPILGVWQQNKDLSSTSSSTPDVISTATTTISYVPGVTEAEYPNPLYILGYGSLLWRPGPMLEDLPSYKCQAMGWIRMFAQYSSDHRGTTVFPGLVMTMLPQDYLIDQGYQSMIDSITKYSSEDSINMLGRVWLCPTDDVSYTRKLIELLDYRERGGYTRHVIEVMLLEATPIHPVGSMVKVLVYTAQSNNPNFYLPSPVSLPSQYSTPSTAIEQKNQHVDSGTMDMTMMMTMMMCRTCDMISMAIGPSGRNIDYLFNLVSYLETNELKDRFLHSLAEKLFTRIGPFTAYNQWKTYSYHRNKNYSKELTTMMEGENGIGTISKLIGWGSNEYNQITPYSDLSKTLYPYAVSIPISVSNPSPIPSQMSTSSETKEKNSFDDCLEVRDSYVWLSSGGTMSGMLLSNGILRLWGYGPVLDLLRSHSIPYPTFQSDSDEKEGGIRKNSAFESIDVPSIYSIQDGNNSNQCLVISNITGITMNQDYLLLIHGRSGYVIEVDGRQTTTISSSSSSNRIVDRTYYPKPNHIVKTLSWDTPSNRPGHLISLSTSINQETKESTDMSKYKVLKVSSGLHHSGLITECGKVFTWGDNKYGQCGNFHSTATTYPDRNTNDSTHSYTSTSMSDEKVQQVDYNSPNELSINTKDAMDMNERYWVHPKGLKLIDIVCGARHTIVVDEEGGMWSWGDNRHGTLGRSVPLHNPTIHDINRSNDWNTDYDVHQKNRKEKKSRSKGNNIAIDPTPAMITDVDPSIRWRRVVTGWSHVIARGVRAMTGETVVMGWGRNDMNQLYPDNISSHDKPILIHICSSNTNPSVHSIRNSDEERVLEYKNVIDSSRMSGIDREQEEIIEVWCGSEYSIAMDRRNRLWSTGWNDHGNLGHGIDSLASTDPSISNHYSAGWKAVLDSQGNHICLTRPWTESVTCGGAHVLCWLSY